MMPISVVGAGRSRRTAVLIGAVLGLLTSMSAWATEVTVYKSPTCGCCKKWVRHLEANGFDVKAHDVTDVVPYKIRLGLTPKLASCHTAVVDGYVVEGHVPAQDIKRLLEERPAIRGLAVPGMPVGSPGMEGPRKERYDVLSVEKDGSTSVYATH